MKLRIGIWRSITFLMLTVGVTSPVNSPVSAGEASGEPPLSAPSTGAGPDVRAIVDRTWDDSLATWRKILPARAEELKWAKLGYVDRLVPQHCYGLNPGSGPAYCSGNSTVFVGTSAMDQIASRFPGNADAGLSFLIAHEVGHHIQRIHGRFELLRTLAQSNLSRRIEYIRKFELEADCLAGVWAHHSTGLANSGAFKESIREALALVGDDSVKVAANQRLDPAISTHGTAAERREWFDKGLDAGKIKACDGLGNEFDWFGAWSE